MIGTRIDSTCLKTIKKRNFQIFLTTYDREWFELARQYFSSSNWEYLEMYVGDEITIDEHGQHKVLCDRPVLIPSMGNLIKAQAYFDAKDYPAAGNYLRKEVERLMRKLLPIEFRVDDSINKEVGDLETLLDRFTDYYSQCGCSNLLDDNLLHNLKLFKRLVLNPASHNDLRSPLYRVEIEQAKELVENLNEVAIVRRELVLEKGRTLYYRNDVKNYEADYILTENLYMAVIAGIKYNDPAFSYHPLSSSEWLLT